MVPTTTLLVAPSVSVVALPMVVLAVTAVWVKPHLVMLAPVHVLVVFLAAAAASAAPAEVAAPAATAAPAEPMSSPPQLLLVALLATAATPVPAATARLVLMVEMVLTERMAVLPVQ